MSFGTKTANFFAKYSTVRWNRIRVLRTLSRQAYLAIANHQMHSFEQYELSRRYAKWTCGHMINTYPGPYCDLSFAPWLEDDQLAADPARRERDDALVVDRLGFVVRHSPSYCAWKIYEQTGRWLKCPAGFYWHARYWQELLTVANGFTAVPPDSSLENGHHYVGILPEAGEHGLVVWFEHRTVLTRQGTLGPRTDNVILVSTYLPIEHAYKWLEGEYGFRFFQIVPDDKVVWVEID